jgi:integrase
MATGIRKRHSEPCGHWQGRRCDCKAGYEAWVYIAREGGKVTQTFKRKDEAKAWRAEALVAANRGGLQLVNRDPRSLTMALSQFIEDMKEGRVRPKKRERYKPSTIRNYDQHLRRRIAPAQLGSMRVTEIRRRDVQGFVDEMLAESLDSSTVNNALNPIQAFYRRAHNREEVAHNPTERIEIPDPGSRRPTRIASREEAAALLAPLRPDDRVIWGTAFYAGLRRGELRALRCCDVDLAGLVICVEYGWDQYEGQIPPKSETSRRTLPLLSVLRDLIDEHLSQTRRSGEDLLFGRSSQAPFDPSTVAYRVNKCWRESKQRSITFHQCRHTFASMLIDAGANPKAVQTFMGHSKIQTTFDVYGHLFPGSRDEVRLMMDRYLMGEGEMTGAQAPEDWGIPGARRNSIDAEDSFIQHSESHAFRVGKPDQQKTPRRGGGALLGLLQGGEICISMYVDPWEVGGLLCAAVALIVGSNEGLMSGAEPSQEALMLEVNRQPPLHPLIRIRTYVRFMCDSGHRRSGNLIQGEQKNLNGCLKSCLGRA